MNENLDTILDSMEKNLNIEAEKKHKAELAEQEKQRIEKIKKSFVLFQPTLISQDAVEKVKSGFQLDSTSSFGYYDWIENDYQLIPRVFKPYRMDKCPSPEMANVLIEDAFKRYPEKRNDIINFANNIISDGIKENPDKAMEWINVLKENNLIDSFKTTDKVTYETAIAHGLSVQCFDFEKAVRAYYNAKCGYLVDVPCGQGDSTIVYREPNKKVAQAKKELLIDVISRGYKPNIDQKDQVYCFLLELARDKKSAKLSETNYFEKIASYGKHRGFSRMLLPSSDNKLPIPEQFKHGFKGFCEGNFDGSYATEEKFIGVVHAVSEDGKTIEAGCRNGQLYGDYKERDADGNILIQAQYKDGQLHGDYKERDADGNIIHAQYKDGQLHGDYQILSPDGSVIIAKHYKDGIDDTKIHNAMNSISIKKKKQHQQVEDKNLPPVVKKIAKRIIDFDKTVQERIVNMQNRRNSK